MQASENQTGEDTTVANASIPAQVLLIELFHDVVDAAKGSSRIHKFA